MHAGEIIFSYLSKVKSEELPIDQYEKAYNRLVGVMKEGRVEIPAKIDERDFALSFIAERAILSTASNSYMTNRTAVAYSKSVVDKLSEKEVEETAKLIGMDFSKELDYRMHVSNYLRFSPDSQDYKLFYVGLEEGYVILSKKKFTRLVEEAIKKILSKQPQGVDVKAKPFADRLKEMLPKPKVRITGEKPACIKAIIAQLEKHENLSHYARWSLAVYLINIGMDINSIVQLYSNLPDFDQKITRYQLDHIQKKGYKTPSCDKMKIYGLSQPECACNNNSRIKSPIQHGMTRADGK